MTTRGRAAVLAGGAVAFLVGGCAREEMPPGTAPDFEAPAVVEMFPAFGAAVPDLEEDAFVRFDEPLGDPRSLSRTVQTSPAWLYEIRAGRRNLRIRPSDGWRPGVVYTFTIPPGLTDLVRNRTAQPIELLFTTGPELTATRTAGKVSDRETVRGVRDAALLVLGADSVPYAAVSDTGGNFALEALPVGEYWAYAFRDQNRNRMLDREFEPHDSAAVRLTETNSVVSLDLWLTAPDSTPPQLGLSEALDSLRIRLEFDDMLEPEALVDGDATVNVVAEGTDEAWPVAEFVVGQALSSAVSDSVDFPEGEGEGEAEVAPEPEAEREAISGVPPDTAGAVPDTTGVLPEGEDEGLTVPARERPDRFVTLRLARPLIEGTYRVSASGFVNLRGLSGGGDTTFVYTAPPEPAPEPEVPAEIEGVEAEDEDAGDGEPGDEGRLP